MEILNENYLVSGHSNYKRIWKLGRIFLIASLFCYGSFLSGQMKSDPQPVKSRVSDLKAVFIYNFAKYVKWPNSSDVEGPFQIGVIGKSPVLQPLEQICSGAKLDGREIRLRRFQSPQGIGNCQILFICADQENHLDEILQRVKNSPVLTIGEVQGLAAKGTLLSFRLVKEHVRFEANIKAIQQSRLQVSAQLLKLAIVVD